MSDNTIPLEEALRREQARRKAEEVRKANGHGVAVPLPELGLALTPKGAR
jgi:hypothetical protein